MNFQNPYLNPYTMMQPYQQPQLQQPVSSQVTRVNGENGARAYQIGPNSSALLLDESGLLVWLVTSDGAGYKTVAPYDITPHQNTPAPDYGSLENRIKRLEEFVNGYAGNPAADCAKQPDAADSKTDGRYGKRSARPAGYDEPADHEQPESGKGYGHY